MRKWSAESKKPTTPFRPQRRLFYYSRTEEGKQYRIYCRKHGNLDAPEEILLDMNIFGDQHDYVVLGIYEISPDHNLLAYGLDTSGAETYTIRVKNLAAN